MKYLLFFLMLFAATDLSVPVYAKDKDKEVKDKEKLDSLDKKDKWKDAEIDTYLTCITVKHRTTSDGKIKFVLFEEPVFVNDKQLINEEHILKISLKDQKKRDENTIKSDFKLIVK